MIKRNNFNNQGHRPRILIAPLDWGLGHATRCIPIINELICLNCDIIIVATKNTFSLLKKEFPTLVFLRYGGYEIRYSRNKKNFLPVIFLQFPRIIYLIFKENLWLKKTIKKQKIDAVISDNRFGMFSKKVPSIYITHQLNIKTGTHFTEIIAQKIHYYFIKKYFQCWIPDSKENGLAGELSHPQILPDNAIYIGPLSRFKLLPDTPKIYNLLITISGPEPGRTIFEDKLIDQLQNFSGKFLLIRGLPSENYNQPTSNSFEIENHLSAEDLNIALEQSEILIGRSGYTTIMDLAALKKKAILIPTPGQTEQEYLAQYLFEKKYFFSADEENFLIEDVLKKTSEFEFKNIDLSLNDYKKAVNEFVLSLKSGNFAFQ